jgi:hypothetical protein
MWRNRLEAQWTLCGRTRGRSTDLLLSFVLPCEKSTGCHVCNDPGLFPETFGMLPYFGIVEKDLPSFDLGECQW